MVVFARKLLYLKRVTDCDESLDAENDGDPNIDELIDVEQLDEKLVEVIIRHPMMPILVKDERTHAEDRLDKRAWVGSRRGKER